MNDHLKKLASIEQNCSDAGWDSYGSEPISADTIALAKQIVGCFGDEWTICPTNDGAICFERIQSGMYDTVAIHSLRERTDDK